VSKASLLTPSPLALLRIAGLRRVFSFPAALSSLLAVLAVLTVRGRFSDPDMWWHLRTAQIIWTTHVIPRTDLFSWTTGHHAWVPHEWLSQLTLYGAYSLGGYSGLMLWLCGMSALLLILGYLLCWLYSGNAKVAFVGALLIWLFSTVGLAVRPQLIGYALLICELLLLHLGRRRDARWFLVLPPLFALWINCHGSFFLGLAVAAMYLFSAWFRFRCGSLIAEPWDPATRNRLSVMLLLSVGAVFLNPVGYRQVVYPVQTMVGLPQLIQATQEFQPTALHSTRGIALLGTIGCVMLLLIVRRAELHWHELLLLAAGTWLALGHERLLFVFGILVAPILCRMLAPSWEGYDVARDRILPNAVLMALALGLAVAAFPSRRNLTAQVDRANPVKAVDFVKRQHLNGPMLNEFVYGGYLIWAAPEHPVFIDGRGDIFEWTGVVQEYGNWATLQSDPQGLLEKYHIGFCLLAKDAPMARVLPLLPGWVAVYRDDLAVIFARTPQKVTVQ
jgi:hypothetical protein